MARRINYCNMSAAAKRAFNKGDGKHGKYTVSGQHIAALDKSGRAMGWCLVVRGDGGKILDNPAITEEE